MVKVLAGGLDIEIFNCTKLVCVHSGQNECLPTLFYSLSNFHFNGLILITNKELRSCFHIPTNFPTRALRSACID